MNFDQLFVPPAVADDYAAGTLTRIFGSIIPRLHHSGNPGLATNNWLESIFTVFNTFGLLAMLVVLTYTIYTMVFDTAADGKTFGQNADTKYTILRTLAGVIGFVPVAGGFSLAQVALLWLVLQGSALADVTWRTIATNMLTGTPLTAGTVNQVPVSSEALLRRYGAAFDTLVTGHLCAMNANRIARVLAGETGLGPAQFSSAPGAVDPVTGTPNPVTVAFSTPQIELASGGWRFDGRQVIEMNHLVSFQPTASYSGRDNFCGAVQTGDAATGRFSAGTLSTTISANRQQQQFQHHANVVMADLSEAARGVASLIFAGERDGAALLAPSRTAVYDAVASYLGGPSIAGAIPPGVVNAAHTALVDQVTQQGWMLAPVWQRGVSSTILTLEMPGDTLTVRPTRQNLIADFLEGRGFRASRSDPMVRDLLMKADSDQDSWDMLAGQVRSLPLPDAPADAWAAMGNLGGSSATQQAINFAFRGILEIFSPVASHTGAGNYGFVDPMLQVQRQGTLLTTAGTGLLAAGGAGSVAVNSAIGSAVGWVTGLGQIADNISSGLMSAGVAMILAGLVMTILIPLVPLIYFYTNVISWLLQVVEAMFAIPLAILQLFAPAREGVLIGGFSRVLLTVFGVFLKPFFMIVGLFLAMLLIAVALTYLHEMFSRLMFFDRASTVIGPTGWEATFVEGVGGLIKAVLLLGLYVFLAFLTVLYGSQIISELGEFAMQAIGAGMSRYNQTSNIADKAVLAGGLSYMGMRNIGARVGTANSQSTTARLGRLTAPKGPNPNGLVGR